MNCKEVADRLSPFMDGELDSGLNERVSLHIESCDACKRDLESFRRIGVLMREVEAPVDTEGSWGRIEAAIPSKRRLSERRSMKWLVPALALAASVGFVLARVTWYPTNGTNTQHEHATHEHGSLAVDFRNVIEFAQLEPQKAISNLVEKYEGKQLDTESATNYIGYRPALFSSMPNGFQRVSTHVLNMPCCKCTATVCQRTNGTSVIVFEHKDEQPVWFGDLPSIDTQCSGKQCRIIESAGQLAVSWRQNDRQFTMVGAADVAEVSQWVETLKL
ncbi:MAG: zf-HC2 domain-containing protein [Planctomycetota bacterium]|nr:zf-HC2 domain-containing protein [Planctomycetota bacterium]